MADNTDHLTGTIKVLRPMVPARDFDISLRFYSDLGFQTRMLTANLAEMTLGACSFFL
jgi:hypothetical protein